MRPLASQPSLQALRRGIEALLRKQGSIPESFAVLSALNKSEVPQTVAMKRASNEAIGRLFFVSSFLMSARQSALGGLAFRLLGFGAFRNLTNRPRRLCPKAKNEIQALHPERPRSETTNSVWLAVVDWAFK